MKQYLYDIIFLNGNIAWKDAIMKQPAPTKPRNPKGKIRDAEDLGMILRNRRKELGYTQIELAQACKCSPRFIGELERGIAGANLKQVLHVCRTLGIDLFAKVRGK